MESDVGLAVYVLALMGLGIPVLVLSTRLSSLSIRHLVRTAGATLAVVSSRFHPLMIEAFQAVEERNPAPREATRDGYKDPSIHIAAKYETFLQEGQDVPDAPTTIAHPLHYIAEEDRQVVILHSSGSSGLPKPIYCSHRYFLCFAVCHGFVSDVEERGLTISTSPFFHVRT
jgi:acyl-CoA synthetase (AMP-forming)/AMP-acid ligase II